MNCVFRIVPIFLVIRIEVMYLTIQYHYGYVIAIIKYTNLHGLLP